MVDIYKSGPTKARHVYRHLLREATYLPLIARPFVTERIKLRFRDHRQHKASEVYLRQARHGLRYLRAANNGSIDRFRKILFLVFGRLGRRRRELVGELVRLEPPTDSAALKSLLQSAASASEASNSLPKRKEDWLDKWDIEKLRAFIISQADENLHNTPVSPIVAKQVDVEKSIPKENIWGRPMAAKLARSKLRNAWKDMAQKVLPPLPRGEWELLRDLATGKRPKEEWRFPPRRTPAIPMKGATDGDAQKATWAWEPYANRPTRQVEYGRSRRMRLMSGEKDETSPTPKSPIGLHTYKPRTLRRLYTDIWKMTATIDKNPSGKGWDIKWPKIERHIPPASTTEFFENAPVIPGSKKSTGSRKT